MNDFPTLEYFKYENLHHLLDDSPYDEELGIDELEYQKSIEDDVDIAYEKLLEMYNQFPDTFPVYRMLRFLNEKNFNNFIKKIEKVDYNVGIYWTWNKESARAYCGSGNFGVLLCGIVSKEDVDWERTLYLNVNDDIVGRGDECENEIRLKNNVDIWIISIETTFGKDLNLSDLKVKANKNMQYPSDNIRLDIIKDSIGSEISSYVPSEDDLYMEEYITSVYNRGDYYDYYELWTDDCWESAYLKDEYKDKSKDDIIKSFVENRFNIILSQIKGSVIEWYFNEEILNIKFETMEEQDIIKESELEKIAEDIAPANVLEDAGVVDEAPPDDIGDLDFGDMGGGDFGGGGIGGGDMGEMGEPGGMGGQKPSPNDDIDWDKFLVENTDEFDNYLEDYYDGLTGVNFSRLT